jgi:hypothetical protein
MLHRSHVVLGDGIKDVTDEQILIRVTHRKQGGTIIAFQDLGGRYAEQGRG